MALNILRSVRVVLAPFYVQRCACSEAKRSIRDGPALEHFIKGSVSPCDQPEAIEREDIVPYLSPEDLKAKGRKVYIETYGCQMNVNDTEIAWSILKDAGYQKSSDVCDADVILAVTCAIRENAESKIWNRLDVFRSLKKKRSRLLPPLKVGVLGCMAERLKNKLLETDKGVDLVAGPDSYRDLPRMLALTESGQSAVNVLLSLDETYGDIMPVRLDSDSPTAFVSIMRGCENMCSFCIVPFTRGQERSRPVQSILEEIKMLSNQGVKEVTLLGQNVNSYRDTSQITLSREETKLSHGFKTIYRNKEGGLRFTYLLDQVSRIDPEMRIRFTSPHPKDFPDELLHLIQERHNICRSVHLPVQSGSTEVLKRMRRGHTREAYLRLVENSRRIIPGVTISSDFITGFCGESPEEHQDTVSLMKLVQYDMAYMFAYSMRKKTHAYHRMKDDVPEEVKQMRLREIIDLFHSTAAVTNKSFIGSQQIVLVEKVSKRNEDDMVGRNDGNMKTVITGSRNTFNKGDYVLVKITAATSSTLIGHPLRACSLVEESKNQTLQSSTK